MIGREFGKKNCIDLKIISSKSNEEYFIHQSMIDFLNSLP